MAIPVGALALFCVFAAAAPAEQTKPAADVLVVEAAAQGKSFSVPVGQQIEFRLEGLASAGYTWMLVKQLGTSVTPPVGVKVASDTTKLGAATPQRFICEAVRPGKAAVTLVLRRSWERMGLEGKSLSVTFDVQPVAPAGDQPALILGEGASGERFSVAAGDIVEVRLTRLFGEGAWQLVQHKVEAVTPLDVAVAQPAGARGVDVLRFRAAQPGTAALKFGFLKPGETKSGFRGVEITLDVQSKPRS